VQYCILLAHCFKFVVSNNSDFSQRTTSLQRDRRASAATYSALLYCPNASPQALQLIYKHSRCSDWLRTERPRGRNSSPGRVKNFLFSTSSRPALGPTQPPIQWVLGDISPEYSCRGVNLTTHLRLLPRSRKYGSTQSFPHTSL
jgi:hypothetical protein